MTSSRLPVAALLLLAACPLPQSVPSVPPGSVTPPRIVEDISRPSPISSILTTTARTTVTFDPSCATPQSFAVTATVADDNSGEAVEYRSFVDYDPLDPLRYAPRPPPASGQLDTPTQEPFTLRPVPGFSVAPAGFGNAVHVLELVVSNGFDQRPEPGQSQLPLPYRTPLTGSKSYEVQSHKWVFVPVLGCNAAATCPPCP